MMLETASEAERATPTKNIYFQGELEEAERPTPAVMVNEEVSPGRSDPLDVLHWPHKFILDGSVMSEALKSFLLPVALHPFRGA